jgi:hypothetical protein
MVVVTLRRMMMCEERGFVRISPKMCNKQLKKITKKITQKIVIIGVE